MTRSQNARLVVMCSILGGSRAQMCKLLGKYCSENGLPRDLGATVDHYYENVFWTGKFMEEQLQAEDCLNGMV